MQVLKAVCSLERKSSNFSHKTSNLFDRSFTYVVHVYPQYVWHGHKKIQTHIQIRRHTGTYIHSVCIVCVYYSSTHRHLATWKRNCIHIPLHGPLQEKNRANKERGCGRVMRTWAVLTPCAGSVDASCFARGWDKIVHLPIQFKGIEWYMLSLKTWHALSLSNCCLHSSFPNTTVHSL